MTVKELVERLRANIGHYPFMQEAADALTTLASENERMRGVRQFAEAILHGDEIHRAWLKEAAEAWIAGKPLPPPRDARAALSKDTPDGK